MSNKMIEVLSQQVSISKQQVNKTIGLLDTGATVPFLSRYRKEVTGGLDEVQIANIKANYDKLQELEKRKLTILKAIEDQGKLDQDLKGKIESTFDPIIIEDLYLPYKKKRQTKAEVGRKNGLEPLAKIIMSQREPNINAKARSFIKGDIDSIEDAIKGAKDIIAEWINENTKIRDIVRNAFERDAVISSKLAKGKAEEAEKFKDYFKYEERLKRCKSHRLLAIRRGEDAGFLKVSIRPDEKHLLERLNKFYIKNDTSGYIEAAIKEAYKRLLAPSIENEFANLSKEKADQEAILVFAENLRQLLLAAPIGKKRILAIDPGFRTGCKVVCLDEKGDLLANETIFPHPPQNNRAKAIQTILHLTKQHRIQAIAVGNATAGRETEDLIRSIQFNEAIEIYVVSESGASVYSASEVAREEFPDYDITVRGSVSIGRRLMDPLAELVKIDAKSIGVGQYQHDVDQKLLQQSLDTVVESCVNKVGVDINSASKHLLSYVSGLGPQLAQNIVNYRRDNGMFKSRTEIKKVARMGDKAFEQCAGFLRIKESKNPLDASAVHPESYNIVKSMAQHLNCKLEELIGNQLLVDQIKVEDYSNETIGSATIKDIKAELLKPGLDPRAQAQQFQFAEGVTKVEDLSEGMVIPGLVTNITNFGAFVDVGVKQDGLVHISNLANQYVANPADFLKLQQQVMVKVIQVDVQRKRIGLSMKDV